MELNVTHPLPAALQRYKKQSVLGTGSFGAVMGAVHAETGDRVALKIMANMNGVRSCEPTSVREATVLQMLQGHPNVVTVHDILFTEQFTYVVMELCSGSLYDVVKTAAKRNMRLSPQRQRSYGRQLLSGLAHCHALNIVHRDLKTANVLVDHATDTVKLCDFGLARAAEQPARATTRDVVTLPYRAPELLLQAEPVVGPELDLWSAGVILYELAALRLPFEGVTEVCLLMQIFQRKGTPTDAFTTSLPLFAGQPWPRFPAHDAWLPRCIHAGLAEVITGLLEYDPMARPTADEAMEMAWFT